MFKREEASRLREEFWTTFGKYMSPIPSAEGVKINWINYRTGIKDVYFRMDISQKSAEISITMEHHDRGMQELYFNQFREFKTLLHATLEEEWEWKLHVTVADGKVISRIYKEITGVSVFNKDHWPDLISFFKPRLISLDSFWENAKYSFEGLK
ncbi:MAG TPA: DUF4268 domain-containing protein [Cyclobacteriaceae bacterium]